jgi:hypothetical protein
MAEDATKGRPECVLCWSTASPPGSGSGAKRGRRVELDVQLAGRIGKASRVALEREAERIGEFLGLEPVLSVGRR